MPRVNRIMRAQKPQGTCGSCGTELAVGGPYIWWAFRYGGKSKRCTKPECAPSRSDLTQSAISGPLWGTVDGAVEEAQAATTVEELESIRDTAAEGVREIAEEVEEKVMNMVDGFGHETEQSYELEERGEALSYFADEIESVDLEELDELDELDEDADEDEIEDRQSEVDEQEQEFERQRDELIEALSNSPE